MNSEIHWTLCESNPLISPPWPSPILADPTFLLPEDADGQWLLIAHSILGLHAFRSADGIEWSRPSFLFANAMRPYLFKEEGTYYLLYEKYRPFQLPFSWVPFPRWKSRIEMRSSLDLKNWSRPRTLLEPHLPWHFSKFGASVSNPCLIKVNGAYRLYYSASLVKVKDCGFCEPLHIGAAESKSIHGPYLPNPDPILSPDPALPFCNLGAGAVKVLSTPSGGLLGFQNGIYEDSGVSGSAILLLTSADGIKWDRSAEPVLKPGKGWMRSHVYALDVKRRGNDWFLYFNARDEWHWTRGKEKIGLLLGKT